MAAIPKRSAAAAAAALCLLTCLGVVTCPASAQAPPPAPAGPPPGAGGPPPGDPLGPDLFIAIRGGDIAGMKTLLAKGAQLEARNWLEITPLMWAAGTGNKNACMTLVEAGAKVEAPSRYGTALSFAEMGGNPAVVRYLLDHGAKADPDRADDISPLMTAADAGHIEALRLLLAHRAVVNARDAEGTTPLMFAARRGQTEAARLLLDAGARIDLADKHGRTALMYAALNGHPGCTSLLVSRHGAVNKRDNAGDTALLLAARYNGNADVARALLRGGADRAVKDVRGRTASANALAHGNAACAAAIEPRAAAAAAAAALASADKRPLPERARAAALRSLPLIERSTRRFSDQATCISCHHQGLGLMTTGLARDRGFPYDQALAAAQIKMIVAADEEHAPQVHGIIPHPEMFKHIPTVDMGEFTTGAAFIYSGLLAHGRPAGMAQADAVTVLASQQFPNGAFGFYLHREPIQSSDFETTALTIRLLRSYLPKERGAEAEDRVQRARAWLIAARPVTNEDRTFRLLGLKWAGADDAQIAAAAQAVRAAQRPDGGWAQMPGFAAGNAYTRSDAYATGVALYALNVGAGMATTTDTYRRGVEFLLRAQDDDGSWFVNKRAIPANAYFDAGFPHGESQFISYGASCWATMALMLAAPPSSSPPSAKGARTVMAR